MWKHDQNNTMTKYKEEISSKTATKGFGDSGLFGKD
jgi:hypothetical protein